MRVLSRVTKLMAEKQLRENRVITSGMLARETGLSRPTILSWIRSDLRRFDEEAIVAFCKYFDCEIGALLELANDD
jgi:hypothetical protein